MNKPKSSLTEYYSRNIPNQCKCDDCQYKSNGSALGTVGSSIASLKCSDHEHKIPSLNNDLDHFCSKHGYEWIQTMRFIGITIIGGGC